MYHQEWDSKSSKIGYRRFIANMWCGVDWDEATISTDYEKYVEELYTMWMERLHRGLRRQGCRIYTRKFVE